MNFSYLIDISKEIHLELFAAYWALLPVVVVLLMVYELLKPENPNPTDVLRRTVISILLLLSFNFVTDIITVIGDGLIGRLDSYNDAWAVLKQLGPNNEGVEGGLFDLRGHFLYFLAVLAYLIAYLGFFMAEAITHFVWLILHICSPLMILCFVPKATAGVTRSLYGGLVKVIVWKVLWMILGALLLKMAQNATYNGLEDYLSSIVLNLCIGLSMLFVPLATKSLLKDGFEGMSAAFSMVPLTVAVTKLRLATASGMKAAVGPQVSRLKNFSKAQGQQRSKKLKNNHQQNLNKRPQRSTTRRSMKNEYQKTNPNQKPKS